MGIPRRILDVRPVARRPVDDGADHREPPPGKMDRYGHTATEPEVRKIAPCFCLGRVKMFASLNVVPIEGQGRLEACPVVRIVRAESLPLTLPACRKVTDVELEWNPLAVRETRCSLIGVEDLRVTHVGSNLGEDVQRLIEGACLVQLSRKPLHLAVHGQPSLPRSAASCDCSDPQVNIMEYFGSSLTPSARASNRRKVGQTWGSGATLCQSGGRHKQ